MSINDVSANFEVIDTLFPSIYFRINAYNIKLFDTTTLLFSGIKGPSQP